MSLLYYKGKDVEQNLEKAFKWSEIAAMQGHAQAQCLLGILFETKNTTKALEWFEKSAAQGFYLAQYNLGVKYHEGKGIEKNLKKAFEWWGKAAKQEYKEAQYNLGCMYFNGEEVKKNYEEAAKWWERAAEQGQPDAQHNLGAYYYFVAEEKNLDKTITWYKKAIEQGHPTSQNNLGVLYCLGKGVKQDLRKAFKLFKESASQGDKNGQYNLNYMYFIERNLVETYKWLEKVTTQEHDEAQDRIEKRLTKIEGKNADKNKWRNMKASPLNPKFLEKIKTNIEEKGISVKESVFREVFLYCLNKKPNMTIYFLVFLYYILPFLTTLAGLLLAWKKFFK